MSRDFLAFSNLICVEKHLSVTEWQGCKFSVLYPTMVGFLGSFEMRKDLYEMNKPQLSKQLTLVVILQFIQFFGLS